MKPSIHKKYLIACLTALVVSFLVLFLVYTIIDKKHPGEIQTQEEYLGDIETLPKKWLNGHLGVFFRFKQTGNINWLVIPLLIWYLVTNKAKKRERWQLALVFVWVLTVVLIAVKGYYNTRYQLTLFPITSAMVLFLLWQFLQDKQRFVKMICFSLVTLACLFNIYHYFDTYKFYWDLRVRVKNPHFPYQLVDYLNSAPGINDRSRVLTINQPLFYYHIPKKGVDYVSSHAIKVWVEFKKRVGTMRSRTQLYRLLRRQLRVKYILLGSMHKRFHGSTMLGEFLHCECKPVLEDQGRLLYRLRDTPLEKQLKSPAYRKIKVWKGDQPTVQTISPPLHRFFKKGIFKFKVSKGQKENTIIVRSLTAGKDAEKRIHFGFEFNRRGLNVKPRQYEGKYVHFIVRAAISPQLPDRDNYIAVGDYNKDGTREAEKTFFTSHHWRTYIVSKKVRPGNSRLFLMFRFCPRSAGQQLAIKDIKIVVSGKPL